MTAAFAACWPCNSGKGDFMLEEIDWQLLAVDDVRSDSSGLTADYPALWRAAGEADIEVPTVVRTARRMDAAGAIRREREPAPVSHRAGVARSSGKAGATPVPASGDPVSSLPSVSRLQPPRLLRADS